MLKNAADNNQGESDTSLSRTSQWRKRITEDKGRARLDCHIDGHLRDIIRQHQDRKGISNIGLAIDDFLAATVLVIDHAQRANKENDGLDITRLAQDLITENLELRASLSKLRADIDLVLKTPNAI